MFKSKIKNKQGFMTLMSVLVTGAVALSAVLMILSMGIGSTQNSLTSTQGARAIYAASACAEEALQKIRDDQNFIGTENLTLGSATCEFTVQNLGGESRSIASSGSVGTIIRRLEIQIDAISPMINIVSWQEVADF